MTDASVFRPDLFRDRHVLVTGGTSGIGKAIAAAFSAHGAAVTVTGAVPAEVEAAGEDLQGAARHVLDVRDDGAIRFLVGSFARLDVLVTCAGVIRRQAEFEPDVFADVLDINLSGTMRACTAARPLLSRSGGSIVTMASMLSFFGGGLVPAYAASKGGTAQLTKSLAIAYAPDGIRVNAIAPGWIETPLTSGIQADPARYATIRDRIALERWGRPDDLAGAALFLASPAAAYVTGVILPVDGGYLVV